MTEASERSARGFFGRRKGHKLRPHQAQLIETLLPLLALDLSGPAPLDLRMLFPIPVSDVALEIGFGGGELMIAQAREHPRTGMIGVEPFINGMAKALAAIESRRPAQHPPALRRCREPDRLASRRPRLARIDLIHPDPWPKRRHWKRRFIQDEMVANLARILRPQGEFRFVTDIADYAAWTLLRLLRSKQLEWTAQCADDWRKPWPGFAQTRYHAKAAREDRASCFLVFRKI